MTNSKIVEAMITGVPLTTPTLEVWWLKMKPTILDWRMMMMRKPRKVPTNPEKGNRGNSMISRSNRIWRIKVTCKIKHTAKMNRTCLWMSQRLRRRRHGIRILWIRSSKYQAAFLASLVWSWWVSQFGCSGKAARVGGRKKSLIMSNRLRPGTIFTEMNLWNSASQSGQRRIQLSPPSCHLLKETWRPSGTSCMHSIG